MKLLVQADDFGFTRGVTYGIIDSIDLGIVRNTGMFVNMPSAKLAASFIKDRPHVCFGIDFNYVSGPCCADPVRIPHLVDEDGNFIRSSVRVRDPRFQNEEGRREMLPADEMYIELRAQYDHFIELTGKKPGYLHMHSLPTETYLETIRKISAETGVIFSQDAIDRYDIAMWLKDAKGTMAKTFDPSAQLQYDPWENVNRNKEYMLSHEYAMVGGHCGYVDADLLKLSSLSFERFKDAEMLMSDEIKKWVEDNDITLITYYDLI
ncbi:MAG: ChbG/HpnK family deacetylase [Erysipelotrichaceae bacterium]|nr:ChbG/HpnK family deacetylase [Erysipelotrichaceae bacterium]